MKTTATQQKSAPFLPSFLSIYNTDDYLTQLKVQFIYKVSIAMCAFTVLLLGTTWYIGALLNSNLNLFTISVEALCLFIISFSIHLLIKGKVDVTIHLLLVTCFTALWTIMFKGDSVNLARFDTIVLTFGVLSMTPLLVHKNKIYIIIYTTANVLLLTLFCGIILYSNQIPAGDLVDYFFDCAVTYIYIATIGYNLYVIFKNAVDRSEFDLSERLRAENEVIKLNAELEEKVILRTNELNAALIKLEESNIELRDLNESIASEASKLVSLNDKLCDSELQLQIANHTKDKFFSIIAHDLRNPFAGLLNSTELLERYFDTMNDEEKLRMITQMKNSAKTTFALLNNLLQWARSQMEKIDLTLQNVNVFDLAFKVKLLLKDQATAKNITLNISVPSDYVIEADADMCETILRNLLTNSIKFTHRGGNIDIGIETIDTRNIPDSLNVEQPVFTKSLVCIYVKDNGIGMGQDIVDKLFKIDEKTSRPGTEKEPSSGLGLLLCKEFIDRHHGIIWVDSSIGEGTTFYFTLENVRLQN